jgi:outer membrane protein OmpA-like peptidoglycan-associated protein
MRKLFLSIYIIFLSTFLVSAQSPSKKSVIEAAEKSFSSKNFYDALAKYQELLQFESDNIDFLYKAAEASRLHGAYKISVGYYEAVLNHPNGLQYPLSGFWLGMLKQMQGDYNSAKAAYTAYSSEHAGEDSYYSAYADKEIKACEWAIEMINNPVKSTTVVSMGERVNTSFSDFAPMQLKQEFVFSSSRFENRVNTIMPKRYLSGLLSSKSEGVPVQLKYLNTLFPGKNIANTAVNRTADKVYFTVCEDLNDHDKRCDLYQAKIDSSQFWSEPIKLPDYINIPTSTQTQPNVGYNKLNNKEVLYFVSDRPGGKGGLDIWYSMIDGNGNFSEPMNLAGLNTIQDDVTPFYHIPTSTLFYSSKGHLGLGGFDIYQVKDQVDGWGTIKNCGIPLNSSFDDLYFVRLTSGTVGYLASNRTGAQYIDDINEACCLDIFMANIQPCEIKLKTLVYDAGTLMELNGATVKLFDNKDVSKEAVIITNDLTNLFEFPIECEREYRIEASRPGYSMESVIFLSGKPGEFKEITKKLYLKQSKITLDVLTYDKQTGLDLNGTTVSLFDLEHPDNSPIVMTNLQTNLSQFELDRCHKYRIVATKLGYGTSMKEFHVDCNQIGTVLQKIYLDKLLYSLLPVSLYFDNDHPNPATMSKTTTLSYQQTYENYYTRKSVFGLKFSNTFPVQEREVQKSVMDNFFDLEVKAGKEKFEKFLSVLESDLKEGKKYEIFLKGYASPLANNHYNLHLGQRRVQSVKNEFNRYNQGSLKKYIKSGKLIISQKSFGEDTAPKGISDNSKDPNSIYHINASRERRVEIVEIKE